MSDVYPPSLSGGDTELDETNEDVEGHPQHFFRPDAEGVKPTRPGAPSV
jgi:hypothetical protein